MIANSNIFMIVDRMLIRRVFSIYGYSVSSLLIRINLISTKYSGIFDLFLASLKCLYNLLFISFLKVLSLNTIPSILSIPVALFDTHWSIPLSKSSLKSKIELFVLCSDYLYCCIFVRSIFLQFTSSGL